MPAHAAPVVSASGKLTCETPEGVAVAPEGVFGWSAGGTGTFRLHDGSSVSAEQLTATITAPSNEWFGDQGIAVSSGEIYVEVVSGTVELVVLWA